MGDSDTGGSFRMNLVNHANIEQSRFQSFMYIVILTFFKHRENSRDSQRDQSISLWSFLKKKNTR